MEFAHSEIIHIQKGKELKSVKEQLSILYFHVQSEAVQTIETMIAIETLEAEKRVIKREIANFKKQKAENDAKKAIEAKEHESKERKIRMKKSEKEHRKANEEWFQRRRENEELDRVKNEEARIAIEKGFDLVMQSVSIHDDGYEHIGTRRLWIEFTTDPIIPNRAVRFETVNAKMLDIYKTPQCQEIVVKALKEEYSGAERIPKDLGVLGIMSYGYYHPQYLEQLTTEKILNLIKNE